MELLEASSWRLRWRRNRHRGFEKQLPPWVAPSIWTSTRRPFSPRSSSATARSPIPSIQAERDEGKKLAEKIESTLDELFGFYARTVNTSSSNRASNQAPIHISVGDEDEENPWDMLASQFELHMEEIESEPTVSELTMYLTEKREKRSKEFDILEYWKISSNKFPVLSLLAKDVLAVPASTVPSESAFNTGGRIIDPLRCSLSTSTVEALICAQSWLHASKGKPSAREAAEEVQAYEDIREEFLSKDCTDNQHCIDLTEFEA